MNNEDYFSSQVSLASLIMGTAQSAPARAQINHAEYEADAHAQAEATPAPRHGERRITIRNSV